ncbi:hypothetical protein PAPYR_8852 [Paratrimastix pyriformis]|uniref:Uncharacterized protein n=1 Tax=Paratrimastix pyriformis TaxID=342808 RepID=A0ABQ8U9V0_9EUKA|nr:hypothetical protein PAPYR_8852 [Paratrimastix pyriformis]
MRCDLLIAQKDKSTAGTDMTCQILLINFWMSVPFCVLAVQVFTLSWFGRTAQRMNENSRAKILAHMEVAKLAAAPLTGALSDLLRRTAIPGGKILVIGEVAKLLPRVLPPPSQVPIRYTAPDTTLPTWWIHGVPLNVSEDAIKTRMDELGIPIESVERIKEPTSNLPTSQVRVTVTTQEVWDRLRALGKFIDGLSVKAERKRGPAPFVRGLD